ncbi:MAG: hypothetical protein Q8Q47_12285, partial [Ignavibacteriaceae bacterium]|nr:hypothetical protein [Ignavibacteriaceae bacterium]
QSFTLTENGEEKGSVTINKTDTAILIENLLPKQTYKYQLKNTEHKSNETEITTLVNEEKQAGKYSLEFNAIRLSSGVYFCEHKTDKNYSARIKMIYLK